MLSQSRVALSSQDVVVRESPSTAASYSERGREDGGIDVKSRLRSSTSQKVESGRSDPARMEDAIGRRRTEPGDVVNEDPSRVVQVDDVRCLITSRCILYTCYAI
jgi:hypothetical protein